jgi:DNA-3-methyladenine glycosylase II
LQVTPVPRDPLLTQRRFYEALGEVIARDADLAGVVQRHGAPTFGTRKTGFASLVSIIIEQQVSVASGRATFERVSALLPQFTAERYLALDDDALRAAGLSRQKLRYTRLLAEAVVSGELPLASLQRYGDARVVELLTAVTGIGRWTADIYLMGALRRPDVWPIGDLALANAVRDLKGLPREVDAASLAAAADHLRPYRSVAARIYWRHYLRQMQRGSAAA